MDALQGCRLFEQRPSQSFFQRIQGGIDRLLEIAVEHIFDRHWVNDYFACTTILGPPFGRCPSHEGDAVQQRLKSIVGAKDRTLWKDHQRSFGVDQHVDGCVERLSVKAFAIDTECPHGA